MTDTQETEADPNDYIAGQVEKLLGTVVDHARGADQPDIVGQALAIIADMARLARDAQAEIEAHLVAVLDGHDVTEVTLGDGTRLERHRRASRKGWDHDAAVSAVLRAVDTAKREMDPESGEVESDAEVAVRLLRECASISSWKKPLAELTGTSMDEWCQESWSDAVKIVRAKR